MIQMPHCVLVALALAAGAVQALEYPYAPYNEGKMDPQTTGWPLSQEAIDFVAKAAHLRRPGSESGAPKVEFLPYTPSADGSGNPNWYVEVQKKLIGAIDLYKKDHGTDIDILLVGDSITWQWIDIRAPYSQYPQQMNEAWKAAFGGYSVFNIGVAGDKTQGVLWRLDHHGTVGSTAPGLRPRLVILAIGHNNMYFTSQTGTAGAAKGILWCVKNLRDKFPDAHVIVSKILPNTNPEAQFYKDAKAINAELDALLAAEPDAKVRLLPDLWPDMTQADGTLIDAYFRSEEPVGKKIHLSMDGYRLWAAKLRPLVEQILAK